MEQSVENVRRFRLYTQHLDAWRTEKTIPEIVGACGMQNTPPGAWETAMFQRVPGCNLAELQALLYREKSLLQAWSFRGAPVVFPAAQSNAFLSALIPQRGEEWIYTHGIAGALDFLQMSFDEVFDKLREVIPRLDGKTVESKTALDQILAQWMLPLLPAAKRDLWNAPSMYGAPDKQTMGGAAVSFLLRPCACLGLVVFGARGGSPTFTSYQGWLGQALKPAANAPDMLVRKFLHCYGPATVDAFAAWLGCSGKQAKRMWNAVLEELEPVKIDGKEAFLLSEDRKLLASPPAPQREWHLLGGHDPYLDQRDRQILVQDKARQRQVWQTVSNPGAVLHRGEIVGVWTGKKSDAGMTIRITLWKEDPEAVPALRALAEEYAAFRGQKLLKVRYCP